MSRTEPRQVSNISHYSLGQKFNLPFCLKTKMLPEALMVFTINNSSLNLAYVISEWWTYKVCFQRNDLISFVCTWAKANRQGEVGTRDTCLHRLSRESVTERTNERTTKKFSLCISLLRQATQKYVHVINFINIRIKSLSNTQNLTDVWRQYSASREAGNGVYIRKWLVKT